MSYDFGQSPSVKRVNVSHFAGVDFASNPAMVENYRSPNAVNVISDLAGKPQKRTGYTTVDTFVGRINGIFKLETLDGRSILVHSGTKLYKWDEETQEKTLLRSDMNNVRSSAFQANKKLWILDGKRFLVYDGTDLNPVDEVATIPKVVIGRNPNGTSGTAYDDLNMLTNKRTYSFRGTASTTEYHLSSDDVTLSSTSVTARVMDSNGDWVDKTETTDFTVNRTTGVITFTTAPGESPASGADNVEITVEVDTGDENSADLINHCTFSTFYGLDGAASIVFFSGNADAPNFHYWSGTSGVDGSEITDPSYIPAMNYQWIGQDNTAIMGYSMIGNYLAVHKEANEQDQTIFLIGGSVNALTGAVSFPIQGSVAGVGAVSKYCFAQLDTEPLFLSKRGVHAVTTQDYTQRRYAQNRSYYIDTRLTEEQGLDDAVAIEYNNRYWLAINGHVYVADGRQKGYQKNAPLSEFQYEWYYLDNIPARVWWEYDNHLWFGCDDGTLKRFYLAGENSASCRVYNDDGDAIRAYWDTPIFTLGTISQYKTLKGLWVMTAPFLRSGIEILYRAKGQQTSVKSTTLDIFDFNDIDFTRFTFFTDDFPRVVPTNTKLKKFVTAQFRFQNDILNDAFGFYEYELQYTIGGRYKG